jgi:endonuclease/exonuclease/phosphatase family metal-dependent hydrolase
VKTLREALSSVEPSGSVTSAVGLLPLLGFDTPCSLREVLSEASLYRRISNITLTIFAQNMALLPWPAPYQGTEREEAIAALVRHLRTERPDIVGLCECFVNGEREQIAAGVADLYPSRLDGPNEGDLESDGGLFLLSVHPIVESHATIYRQCLGDDCFTNKGVLHARIDVAAHQQQYDVFLSHMQSCPPAVNLPNVGPGATCDEKLQVYQNSHLNAFVQAYSSPRRPAILLGDLNQDGVDTNGPAYLELVSRLWHPIDVWLTAGPGGWGITTDHVGSAFKPDQPSRPVVDAERHHQGERLDYCFSWPGPAQRAVLSPLFSQASVRVLQSSPGRDISDHYGITALLRSVRELDIDEDQQISRVAVTLAEFGCLQETGGPVPLASEKLGSDEVEFDLRLAAASGSAASARTRRFGDVDSGDWQAIEPGVEVTVGDPGAALEVEVEGFEVDTVWTPFGRRETGRVSLGPERLTLERRDLLMAKGTEVERILPILTGDDGEYAARVIVRVE